MPRFLRETALVTRRELAALLVAPLYYVLCGTFFVLSAYVFMSLLVTFSQESLRVEADMSANVTQSVVRQTFFVVHFFLLGQVPLLTMRVFAEDKASGTLDLLQTTPLSDWALLLGKFLGCLGGLLLYLLLTLAFPLATAVVSHPEWPVVATGFIALVLTTAAYTAVGLFFSSLTESQVIAAVFTYVALLAFVLVGALADISAGRAIADLARHLSITEHAEAFLKGDIAFFNVVYFPMVAVVFLFLTARVLEARRWAA